MPAPEGHRQTIALDRIHVMKGIEIVALDDKVRIGGRFFEFSGRVHRVDDG